MKVISFINLKGGVGKTTLSTNFAYLLAESWDLRVLFIDNDKQGNASRWLGADKERGTLANIFMDGAKACDVIQESKHKGIDFIAADMGLMEANMSVLKDNDTRQDVILKQALSEIQEEYDLCVIDNPPDVNMSVFNSLTITDDVIIVSSLEIDSIEGVRKTLAQISDAKKYNPMLNVRGVLINQYLAYTPFLELCQELEKETQVFTTKIAYASRDAKNYLMTASMQGKSLFEISPNCRVARDIMKFAEELLR